MEAFWIRACYLPAMAGPGARLTLDDVVTAAGAGRSMSRRRQLTWIGREISTFLATPPRRPGPSPWRAVLSGILTEDYLVAADAGLLRSRSARVTASPESVRRVRRDCLRLLAAQAGLPPPPLSRLPMPATHPAAPAGPARQAQQHLRTGSRRTSSPGQLRAAVVVALVRETGLRTGELAGVRVRDLDLDAGTLSYQPRPQAGRSPRPPVTASLSPVNVRLLQAWLAVREQLTVQAPRTKELLVSLAGNHDGFGVRRPAGLALQPRGLTRAHARHIAQVNADLLGSPGYEPLPRTLGPLRPSQH